MAEPTGRVLRAGGLAYTVAVAVIVGLGLAFRESVAHIVTIVIGATVTTAILYAVSYALACALTGTQPCAWWRADRR